MRLPPASVLLSWPSPNYVDPITRGPELHIITGISLGLATIAICVRLYARLFVRRWFGLDDVFICLAFLSTIGVTTTVTLASQRYNWDRHVWDMKISNISGSIKSLFLACIFWALSSAFIRLSLLMFYYRLLDHVSLKRNIWLLHCVVAATVAFLIAYSLTLVLSCTPVRAYWTWPELADTTCINIGAFMLTCAILNTVFELITALLPIPVVLSLHMTKQQRWSVISVLSLGFLVVIVGSVRVYFVWKIFWSWDTNWWAQPHWICSEVENNLALICACAPALRPLLGRLFSQKSKGHSKRHPIREIVRSRPPGTDRASGVDSPSPDSRATLFWFDLEGINNSDNFGYTVSIAAGRHASRTKQDELLSKGTEPRSMSRSLSRRFSRFQKQEVTTPPANDDQPVPEQGIVERRSFEIRESFHEPRESNDFWRWRPMSEKDIESDVEKAAAGIDFSILDRPPSRSAGPGHPETLTTDTDQAEQPSTLSPLVSVSGRGVAVSRPDSPPPNASLRAEDSPLQKLPTNTKGSPKAAKKLVKRKHSTQHKDSFSRMEDRQTLSQRGHIQFEPATAHLQNPSGSPVLVTRGDSDASKPPSFLSSRASSPRLLHAKMQPINSSQPWAARQQNGAGSHRQPAELQEDTSWMMQLVNGRHNRRSQTEDSMVAVDGSFSTLSHTGHDR